MTGKGQIKFLSESKKINTYRSKSNVIFTYQNKNIGNIISINKTITCCRTFIKTETNSSTTISF